MEYASNAKGNLGVTLGAIGTGLSALGGTNILGGLFGNNAGNQYVNKEAYEVQLKLIDAEKNNAILSADLSSEKKMVEVFNAANEKIMTVREEINTKINDLRQEQFNYTRAVEQKVDEGLAAQAVMNTSTVSSLNLLNNQVSQLFGLTKLGIPNSSLCPGYGNVYITPSGTGTVSGTTTA